LYSLTFIIVSTLVQYSGEEFPSRLSLKTTKFSSIRRQHEELTGLQNTLFLFEGEALEDFHTGETFGLKDLSRIHAVHDDDKPTQDLVTFTVRDLVSYVLT
jgi:hypothetical protein